MARYDFDLFTIGAGSGGVAGSRRAGSYGAKVGIAESVRIGGTCVLRGCVPKKLLVYGAEFADGFEDAAGFGWSLGERRFDWARLIAAKNKERIRRTRMTPMAALSSARRARPFCALSIRCRKSPDRASVARSFAPMTST